MCFPAKVSCGIGQTKSHQTHIVPVVISFPGSDLYTFYSPNKIIFFHHKSISKDINVKLLSEHCAGRDCFSGICLPRVAGKLQSSRQVRSGR